jgi:ubiquinone/menaquinone biosynthesis C-methylase UbiE
MSFEHVAATDYDRFMGRFSEPLARVFADAVDIGTPAAVLDVGSGPGALTRVLVERCGAAAVSAVDPSEAFVAALRMRHPGVDARVASAEALPFADHVFDAVLAELVVHFMTDAAAGVREMVRVARPGGVVAACVWDFENRRAPHSPFLAFAAEETGRGVGSSRPGTASGDLARRLSEAGCTEVEESELEATSLFAGFDEWWEVHTLGVGSTASALDGLDAAAVERVRGRARASLGDGPITLTGTAWAARGIAPAI